MSKFSLNSATSKLGIITGTFLPSYDDRGDFTRLFDSSIFAELGFETGLCQVNRSYSKHKGTLRGFHYQLPPSQEDKFIFCVAGCISDVVLDVRPVSPSWLVHESFLISRSINNFLIVPKGFAHGYQTLEDNTEIIYITSQYYNPALERSINILDPKIDVRWPIHESEKIILSPKDQEAPYLQ